MVTYGSHAVGEGDAPFNMAMMFYYRLNELLMHKDRAAIGNDMHAYYACLKAVYNNVHFQIKEESNVKDIEERLARTHKILFCPLPSDRMLAAQTIAMNHAEARDLLDKIDCDLMIAMDKKKMIFPRIEITQGIKAVRDRLGLETK